MVNNVIEVVNYVIAARLSLLNFVIADSQCLPGVPCQVVMAAGEGVVGHGVEPDVQQVAAQAKFEVGGYAASGLPVLVEVCADVDVCPGPIPWPPVEEPGGVIEPVAVQSVAPVDNGAEV